LGLAGILLTWFWYNKVKDSLSRRAHTSFNNYRQALQAGDFQKAHEQLEDTALSLIEPDNLLALRLQAALLAGLRPAPAILAKLLPNLELSGRIEITMALMTHGHYSQALAILDTLPSETRSALPVLNLRATCLLETEQLTIALELLQGGPVRRRKMDAHFLEFRYLLGKAYSMLGDKKRANRELAKLLAQEPSYKDARELYNTVTH
jgi:tetratricopeptide (TPR) repeat protein